MLKKLAFLFLFIFPLTAFSQPKNFKLPPTLQKFKDDGVLVLYHDYRAGHTLDLSGNDNNGTGTNIDWTAEGAGFYNSAARVDVADSAELRLSSGSIIILCPPLYGNFVVLQRLISKRDAGGTNYEIGVGATGNLNLSFRDLGGAHTVYSGTFEEYEKRILLGINFADSDTPELYVNGIYDTDFTGAVTMGGDDAQLFIGNNYTYGQSFNHVIQAVLILNRKLTADEHVLVYSELTSLKWPRHAYSSAEGVYGPELITDGDMEAAGTAAWLGASGTKTKENGTVLAGSQILRVAYLATASPYVYQLTPITAGMYRTIGYARGDGTFSPRVYSEGITFWSGTSSNIWQRIDIVYNKPIGAGSHNFICTANAAGYCEWDNISVKEVYTPKVEFKTDWGVHAGGESIASGNVYNSPFIRNSGTWTVSTDTIEGKITKILECVAAGTVYIPTILFHTSTTNAANGTFEFWASKADASYFNFGVIASDNTPVGTAGQQGYSYSVTADERVEIREFNGAVVTQVNRSADGYISANTWVKFRLTRSVTNVFSFYINDILVPAANGSNPFTDDTYTTSNYMIITAAAGDKIALSDISGNYSFTKWQGVIPPKKEKQ